MTSKLLGQAIGLSGTTGNSTNLTVSSNGSLQLAANGGTDIYIAANGNIGINNTTPNSSLSVSGSAIFNANAFFDGGVKITGTGILGITQTSPGIISYEYPYTRFYVGDGTGYSFAFSKRVANTTTDFLTISDTSGSIGIGAVPTYASKLDIKGNNEDGVVSIYSANGAIRFRPYVNAISGGQIAGLNSGHTAYAGLTIDGSPLSLATAGSERIRVLANGSITIGDYTAAGYGGKLSVTSPAANQASIFVWSAGLGSAQIGINTGSSNLKLYNTYADGTIANGKGIDIDSSGRVGIGTTSPSYPLVVSDGGAKGIEFIPNSDTTVSELLAYNRSGTVYSVMRYRADSHQFYGNTTERMRIGNGGVQSIQFDPIQVANSNANTLDDYEEGLWTPSCLTSGVSVSNIITAKYTKIGRYVHATTYLQINNASGGTKTFITLTGLPFASDGYGPCIKYYGTSATVTDFYIESSTVSPYLNFSSGAPLPTGTTGWMFEFSYLTST